MATSTGKASITHDSQMPPNQRPNFCSALENQDCPSAPTTLPVVWRLPQAGFLQQAPKRKLSRGGGNQLSLEPHLCPSNRWYIFTDSASVGAWASP